MDPVIEEETKREKKMKLTKKTGIKAGQGAGYKTLVCIQMPD
jgi:hypothetical protein